MTQLWFLGPDGSLPHFPARWELERLGKMEGEYAHLDAFVEHVSGARERLWVFDCHFWEMGFIGLSRALMVTMVPDIRIVSEPVSEKEERLKQLEDSVERAWRIGQPSSPSRRRAGAGRVAWRDTLARRPPRYPYPHDRFVVLDQSLWHFGYSACGSGNRLSAASGPWPAGDTHAIEFFEEIWQTMR